ncbi:MAG: hypothetical protein RLZZ360_916 [Candidatus Parcubacteria bacterium]|jgi:hypothetical protein
MRKLLKSEDGNISIEWVMAACFVIVLGLGIQWAWKNLLPDEPVEITFPQG